MVKGKLIRKIAAVFITAVFLVNLLSGCAVSIDEDGIKALSDKGSKPANVGSTVDTKTSDEEGTDAGAVSEEKKEKADAAPDAEVTFREASIPEGEWQLDVSFPDWRGDLSSTYAINNCVGFYGYSGQGQLYMECDDEAESFDLFLNGKKIDVPDIKAGGSYLADISGASVDGMNSVMVSGLEKGNVRVCIPYPVVTEGKPEEAGLQEEALELIDRIISADIENGFSSAQLAIVKDGKLVYENAWGNVRTYDENGNPIESSPVTTDTLYDLASNTKMYSVNYAIQYLLTKGEADLDSRIVDILGSEFSDDTIKIDYEGYDAVSLETNKKWKEELTVRDLLRHQGGFPPGPHYYNDRYDHATQDFDSDAGNVIYVGTAGDLKTREETLKAICQTPLMYEPGTQTIYSDVDYMILCYCVEKITGKRMDEYLSEVFFEPMGLSHITYNPLENGFTKDDCAATELMGNTRDGNLHYSGIREETIAGQVHDPNAYYCMAGISGHAGLFSNASDLAKLASLMLTGGYDDRAYFKRDVIDLFTAPKGEAYPNFGLGWWREADHRRDWYFGSITDSETFGHQGFTGTLTMIDPDNDLVIVLLTNKIHTQMMENDETLSKWNGNFYLTSTLGFVPQIVEMGMYKDTDENVWADLVSDMILDAKRQIDSEGITDEDHPRMKTLKTLLSVKDQYGK